jgi:HEAT repeat protein
MFTWLIHLRARISAFCRPAGTTHSSAASGTLSDLPEQSAALIALVQTAGDWTRRRRAAYRLGLIVEPATTAALIAVVQRDDDAWVTLEAIEALGRHADPQAVSVLVTILRSTDELLRYRAQVAALRQTTPIDPRTMTALGSYASDICARRAKAAWALGAIGDTAAVTALGEALFEQGDLAVPQAAAQALAAIADDTACALLARWDTAQVAHAATPGCA